MSERKYDPPDPAIVDGCLARYATERHAISLLGESVRGFFSTHPELTRGSLPPVHSVRFRMKDAEHLREKINRKKILENREITGESLLDEVTDLAGVRVLHLHTDQFPAIHAAITSHVEAGHWLLNETPTAYTWDPEFQMMFGGLGIDVSVKDSHYTSVHYVVRANATLPITCEIQVRTLFEEVWGEIDHVLNYPVPTQSVACREQLRVMAKMVGAGSRLADAILRSHAAFEKDGIS